MDAAGKIIRTMNQLSERFASVVVDGIVDGSVRPVDPAIAAASIMGVVLQTALFHIYGRIAGRLTARAPALTRAAIAAVGALALPG